jgi:hypothetical protein
MHALTLPSASIAAGMATLLDCCFAGTLTSSAALLATVAA